MSDNAGWLNPQPGLVLPCNVTSRETAIAAIILVLAVLGEVAVPGALVALQSPAQAVLPVPGVGHHLLPPQYSVSLVLLLGTVPGKVTCPVAPAREEVYSKGKGLGDG